jgi:HAD superfamily hydrolase (TIGR01459 family)
MSQLKQIIDKYDIFLLDIFGLIHDGVVLYSGAIEMLEQIKKQNKRSIFVSNAPRSSGETANRLAKFGITHDLYDTVFTPADSFLKKCTRGGFDGKKYYAIGKEEDIAALDKFLKMSRVLNPIEADIAIIFDAVKPADQTQAILQEIKSKNLPMVCVNPDVIIKQTTTEGIKTFFCAGWIGQEYEKLDGSVEYFGKPYSLIYEEVFQYIKSSDKSKIIALGDSCETDIKGANNANIDSLLVMTGIYSHMLDSSGNIDFEMLKKEQDLHNATPTYIIKNLHA